MRRAVLTGLVVVLLAPAAASARGVPVVPPGNSAVNQYVEIVPTAGGGQPSGDIHPGSVGGGATAGGEAGVTALAPSTARVLAHEGPAGIQTAAIVRVTAPAGVDGRQTASHAGSQRASRAKRPTASHARHRAARRGFGSTPSTGNAPPPTTGAAASQHSRVSDVLQAMTGAGSSGGLGPLMPALLAVTVCGALALAIRRRRQ